MTRLFYAPHTCSLAALVAMEFSQLPYEAVPVDLAGERAALRRVSPQGKVPVLEHDGEVVTETVAILYRLDDLRPEIGLLPRTPADRARALSVLAWFTSTLHIVRRQFARPAAFATGKAVQAALAAAAVDPYWRELRWLDAQILEGRLDGPSPCLAVRAYALLFHQWARADGLPVEELQGLSALADDLLGAPQVAAALARHVPPSPQG